MSYENLKNDDRYDVKTFRYSEDGVGAYTIMAIRLDGEGHTILGEAGWRGEYCIFLKVDGGATFANNDEFAFANQITAVDDDHLKNLLFVAKRKDWDILTDGKEYTPMDIERICGDFDGVYD